jgi:hypothetical protein
MLSRFAVWFGLLAGLGWSADSSTYPPFQLGPVSLQPYGFFEGIGMWRSAATGDTVSTKFGSIPLYETPSESLFSVGHSRMSLHSEMTLGPGKIVGYVESDFLDKKGQGPYRWRQYWGEYKLGNWEFLGGQAWSLLRPNRSGITSENGMMNTLAVEPNYHVGVIGPRRQQLRVVRHARAWHAAVAYERGGLMTAKVAHDGKLMHAEIQGLAGRSGRRGIGTSEVVRAGSRLKFVSQQFVAHGEGPDALGLLPGRVSSLSTIEGAEVKVQRNLEVYCYGGIVYGGRSTGNRTVREWTAGFTRKFPLPQFYGVAAFSGQYSQVDRAIWTGGHGAMNYVQVSFRYYILGER